MESGSDQTIDLASLTGPIPPEAVTQLLTELIQEGKEFLSKVYPSRAENPDDVENLACHVLYYMSNRNSQLLDRVLKEDDGRMDAKEINLKKQLGFLVQKVKFDELEHEIRQLTHPN